MVECCFKSYQVFMSRIFVILNNILFVMCAYFWFVLCQCTLGKALDCYRPQFHRWTSRATLSLYSWIEPNNKGLRQGNHISRIGSSQLRLETWGVETNALTSWAWWPKLIIEETIVSSHIHMHEFYTYIPRVSMHS